MTTPLEQQVRAVARHAVRLTRWYAVGRFTASAGLLLLFAGTLDFLVRYRDPGLIWLMSAVVWTIMLGCFYRFIYRGWRQRYSDLQVAGAIERRFPELADRLSSAVAFAHQSADDALAGSAQLRRLVVAETQGLLDRVDASECLQRRGARRALAAALIPVVIFTALLVLDARSTHIATARIFAPWAAPAWPRRHVLQFEAPATRVVHGQDYQVKLVDLNGKLPRDLCIEFWPDGDSPNQVQTIHMQADGAEFLYRRTGVTRGFRLRATGGDDRNMSWLHVAVVPGPKIVTLELTLRPPAYTGLPERRATRQFQAIEGTEVVLHARTDRPLADARLVTDTGDSAREINLVLDRDRRGCKLAETRAGNVAWKVTKNGVFKLVAHTADGLDAGAIGTGSVQVIPDKAPLVSLLRPTSDLSVTARAQVPVEVTSEDDLAVKSVELAYATIGAAGSTQAKTMTLWQGPPKPLPGTRAASDDDATRITRTTWDLATMPNLQVGNVVEFHAVAYDYKPQQGTSVSRRLTIISRDELLARIAAAQSELLSKISEAVEVQRQTRARTASLETQARAVGRLQRSDVDQLQSVQVNQRQVRQLLADSGDSVHARITRLLDQLACNRVDRPETVRRLSHLDQVIVQMNRRSFGLILNDLVDTLTITQDQLAEQANKRRQKVATEIVALLHRAGQNQDFVIDDLERLLKEFSQWDNYQQLVRQLGQIRKLQKALRSYTAQLRAATLGMTRADLTLQQRTDLRRAAEQQNDLSRRFDRWLGRLEQSRDQLRDSDPSIADLLTTVWNTADDRGVSLLMYDAGQGLQDNRLGQTLKVQLEVLSELATLQELLTNPRAQRPAELLQKLEQAAARVQVLQQAQQHAAAALAHAAELTTRQRKELGRQEAKAAADAAALSRVLQRLGVQAASNALQQAQQALTRAEQAAPTGSKAMLRKHVADAERNLDAAKHNVEAALSTSRQRAGQRQQELLRQFAEAIAEQERDILQRTQQEDQQQSRDESPDATAGQRIDALAGRQQQVRQDVVQMTTATESYLAFAFVLKEIARSMQSAQTLLQQREVGAETQLAEQRALRQIDELRSALTPNPPPPDNQNKPPKTQAPQDNKTPPKSDPLLLSQLKLIRMLQQDVNEQTKQLHAARRTGNWTEEMTQRQRTLTKRQGELADLLRRLISGAAQ